MQKKSPQAPKEKWASPSSKFWLIPKEIYDPLNNDPLPTLKGFAFAPKGERVGYLQKRKRGKNMEHKRKRNDIVGKWVTYRYIVLLQSADRTLQEMPIVCESGDEKGEIFWGGSNSNHYVPSFLEVKDAKIFAKRAIRKLQHTINSRLGYKTIKIGVIEL